MNIEKMTQRMEQIGERMAGTLIRIAIVLLMVLVCVQVGIYHGRAMERVDVNRGEVNER